MCRKIYGSVYHALVKDLDPEKVCHALKRLTRVYKNIVNSIVPDNIRDKIFNPNYQTYSVQLSKVVLDRISSEASDSWNMSRDIFARSIAENRCSDVILDNIKALEYDKHIGRALCPFMIDKNKDQKDSVMNDFMPLVLQVEHFNENGEIESVLDIVNSLVKYPPVSEQIIYLLVRAIEEFFYVTGYYPRVSRDIGLVLLWEASREEKDTSPENGTTLFEENLRTVCSGGYFRTLMKNTDIDKPLSTNVEMDQDVSIIDNYYKSLFNKDGLNVVYTIDGFDVGGYNELLQIDFGKEDSVTEDKMDKKEEENKSMNIENEINGMSFVDEAVNYKEEIEKAMNESANEDSLWKKIAVVGGCVIVGALAGWGISKLFDDVFDTTEVVNDDNFFKF